ncbi:hypothetical protein DEMA109039_07070 [Deinococcus marmoris]
MTRYDAVVIGGGMAGLPLALKLGFKGRSVALIERGQLSSAETCAHAGHPPLDRPFARLTLSHCEPATVTVAHSRVGRFLRGRAKLPTGGDGPRPQPAKPAQTAPRAGPIPFNSGADGHSPDERRRNVTPPTPVGDDNPCIQ